MITTRPAYDAINANLRFHVQEMDDLPPLTPEAQRLLAVGRDITRGRAA